MTPAVPAKDMSKEPETVKRMQYTHLPTIGKQFATTTQWKDGDFTITLYECTKGGDFGKHCQPKGHICCDRRMARMIAKRILQTLDGEP